MDSGGPFVNAWDAGVRASRRLTSRPEAEQTHLWFHSMIQGLDALLDLFRDS